MDELLELIRLDLRSDSTTQAFSPSPPEAKTLPPGPAKHLLTPTNERSLKQNLERNSHQFTTSPEKIRTLGKPLEHFDIVANRQISSQQLIEMGGQHMNNPEEGRGFEAGYPAATDSDTTVCGSMVSAFIFVLSLVLIVLTFPFSLCICLKMVQVSTSYYCQYRN